MAGKRNARRLKRKFRSSAHSVYQISSLSPLFGAGPCGLSPPVRQAGAITETNHDQRLGKQAATRLARGPWVPALAVTGWLGAAYVHLRPSVSVTSSPHPLAAYGPWAYAHLEYSDTISLYYAFHLANHALPYFHTRVEYPVLTGLFMWLAAWAPGVQGYFLVSSLGLLGCAVATTFFLHRLDWRFAWAFALCPLLLVYGMLNWDLLAISFMVAGWAQFRAHRYGSAGILLSLAVWAKFFPVILFFYCIVRCYSEPARRAHARRMALRGGAVALLVNVPFAVSNLGNWGHFFVFNARRGGGGGILSKLHIASGLSVLASDLLSGLLVGLVGILLVPRVFRGGSPIVTAAVVFAVLMLVNKVYSPQYMLWLFVFGILAEWPVWSLVLMGVAGLVDYGNAMMALYLSHIHSPAFSWFFHVVNPWNVALRYASIAVALFAALLRARSVALPASAQPLLRRVPSHDVM